MSTKFTAPPGRFAVWGAVTNPLFIKGAPAGRFLLLSAGGHEQTLAINTARHLELHPVPGPSDPPPDAAPPVPGTLAVFNVCGVGIGRHHALAIDSGGALHVWPPAAAADGAPTAGTFAAVTGASAFYSAAIDTDGHIVTWGGSGDPPGIPGLSALALARMRVDPPVGRFTAIAARGRYTLALSEDGTLYGWGVDPGTAGTDYRIFRGTSTSAKWTPDGTTADGQPRHYIAPMDPANPYVDIAAGLDVILALRANGTIVQWAVDTSPAMETPPDGTFTHIAAGGLGLAAAIDDMGKLHAWGRQPWIPTVSLSTGIYSALSAATNHLAAIEVPRQSLWPPNHKMRTVVVTFRADDNCVPVPLSSLSVQLRSSQPDNGFDSGNTTGDTNGEDGHTTPVLLPAAALTQNDDGSFTATFEVRAERADALPESRIYTVTAVSRDDARPAYRRTRLVAQIVVEPGGQ